MTTWADFQRQLDRTNREIDKLRGSVQRSARVYVSLGRTYQEWIDYCEEFIERMRRK